MVSGERGLRDVWRVRVTVPLLLELLRLAELEAAYL